MLLTIPVNTDQRGVVSTPEVSLAVFGNAMNIDNILVKQLKSIARPVKQVQRSIICGAGP